MGIPPDAMKIKVVQYQGQFHAILDLDASVDGRPWHVAFDQINSYPFPVSEEARMGYAPRPIFGVFDEDYTLACLEARHYCYGEKAVPR